MNATKTLKDATRTKGRVWTYVISIAIALGVGGLSALLTMDNMDLYSDIRQPPLAPPAILFPIVWTVLYVLMGVSAAMVLTDGRHPGALKDAVCSPGGSTIEGVKALEDGKMRGTVSGAVVAAYEKTLKLGK